MSNRNIKVSLPLDAGIYHFLHRALLRCTPQKLLGVLVHMVFNGEIWYVNKIRPLLGFRYSEKYLAYSWILGSPLLHGKRRMLDIGCGDSLFPCELAKRNHEVYTIDLDRDFIAAKYHRVNFVQSDTCYLPFQPGAFDVIVSISALEHIPIDVQSLAVQEISRTLHEGSLLFITMPDCDGARNMCQLLIRKFKVLTQEHRILTSKKITVQASLNTMPIAKEAEEGVGVTFLILTSNNLASRAKGK